jgi:FtsZ-interacting cell division protein ZipA
LSACRSFWLRRSAWSLRNQRLAEWNRLQAEARARAAELVDEARTQAEQQLTQARTDAAEQKLKAQQQQAERELQQRRESLKRGRAASRVVGSDAPAHRAAAGSAHCDVLNERERNLTLPCRRGRKAAQERRTALLHEASELLQKQAGETFAERL